MTLTCTEGRPRKDTGRRRSVSQRDRDLQNWEKTQCCFVSPQSVVLCQGSRSKQVQLHQVPQHVSSSPLTWSFDPQVGRLTATRPPGCKEAPTSRVQNPCGRPWDLTERSHTTPQPLSDQKNKRSQARTSQTSPFQPPKPEKLREIIQ